MAPSDNIVNEGHDITVRQYKKDGLLSSKANDYITNMSYLSSPVSTIHLSVFLSEADHYLDIPL